MSIRDTTISTGQTDQLEKPPADKAQDYISKQLELILSGFAELKNGFNTIAQENAELKQEVTAITTNLKEKLSANEQQKAEFKKEAFAKFSTQEKRPDTASELIIKNGAPPTSTLTLTSLHEEVLINEVNNDPKLTPAFQPPLEPQAPSHGHRETKLPLNQPYPDQSAPVRQRAIYKQLSIPGVHTNILITDIDARREFETQCYTHLIQHCPKEGLYQFDSIHVPKPTTVKDATSFERYFELLLTFKSTNWVTDDRIIPWIDQAIRSTRNARLEKVIDVKTPTATALGKPILWSTIYAIAIRQAAKQVKQQSFSARVADCFQKEKTLGDAWLDYMEIAADGIQTFGAEANIICYYLWHTCPDIMQTFVQRSNCHLAISAVRNATLTDYAENMPKLVDKCKRIDQIALEDDMTWYLEQDESGYETMIRLIRSVSQTTRPPRDTTSYKYQQREPITPKYQHREPPNQRYQNTAKHQCYICDGKPHSEPHTSTNCPCTIRNLASGHMRRHQNGRLRLKDGTVLKYADRPVNLTFHGQLIHDDPYLAVANKPPVACSDKLEIQELKPNMPQITLEPKREDVAPYQPTDQTEFVCSLYLVDHDVQTRSKHKNASVKNKNLAYQIYPWLTSQIYHNVPKHASAREA